MLFLLKKNYTENYFIKFWYDIKPLSLHPKRYKNLSMNLLIVHSRSGADHKPYHIPAIHDIVLSSTLPPLIINGERVMYLTAEIRRSLYSPSTSLRIENDQTRPGGLSFSVRPHQHTRAHVFIQPNERTNERVSRSQSSLEQPRNYWPIKWLRSSYTRHGNTVNTNAT